MRRGRHYRLGAGVWNTGGKIGKRLSCLKVRAYTEVLHRGDAAERWERRGAFARRCRWKVTHSCSVWTVICMLLAGASENCVISGHMFRSSAVYCWWRSSDPFSRPPATVLTSSTPGSENSGLMWLTVWQLPYEFNKLHLIYLWVILKGFKSCKLCRYRPRLFVPFCAVVGVSSSSSGSGWREESGRPSTRPASSNTSGNMADPLEKKQPKLFNMKMLQMYSTTWMHSKNPAGLLLFLHF